MTAATFKSKYAGFLKRIRAKEPDAILFAMRPYGGYYEQEIREAVADIAAAGDECMHYINGTGWLSPSDFVDGIHPTDAGKGGPKALRSAVLSRPHIP